MKAKELNFLLSEEDKKSIQILEQKYDQETNCAGLAAPQIGISKRVIIFAVQSNEEMKKWRPDLTNTMPKTIWINSSYYPIDNEKHEDYEGCFSIENAAAPVARYKKISYQAYDQNGHKIEGTAEEFLARVIQHEIDHLNRKLFVGYVSLEKIMTEEEYLEKRKRAMNLSSNYCSL